MAKTVMESQGIPQWDEIYPISLVMYEKLGYKVTGYADWRKGRFKLMEKVLKF